MGTLVALDPNHLIVKADSKLDTMMVLRASLKRLEVRLGYGSRWKEGTTIGLLVGAGIGIVAGGLLGAAQGE